VKRGLVVGLFALLGLVSVPINGLVITWICEHVGGLCRQAGSNCPIDNCTPHGWHGAELALFFFAPAVIFGGAAYVFGRRPHLPLAWVSLGVGLIVLHALLMFAVTYA
jgi:hypothetical protein